MLFDCDGIQMAVDRIPEGGNRDIVVIELCASLSCTTNDIRVEKDALGAPRLVGTGRLPAISFSSFRGERWIAVAWAGRLGMDVACPQEFEPPYPYARVFSESEVALAASLGQEGPSGYALLWSLKESVAKALGTGFHRVEPRELVIGGLRITEQGLSAEVAGPAVRFSALAVPVDDCWLALAIHKG